VAGIAGASEGRLRFLLAREWRIRLGRKQAKARGGVTVMGRTPSIDVAAAGARTEAGLRAGAWCRPGGVGGADRRGEEGPRRRWRAQATFHDGGADIAYESAWILGHLPLSKTGVDGADPRQPSAIGDGR
jgi:hypothetical protein